MLQWSALGSSQNYVMIRLVTWIWSIRRKYQPRAWSLPSTWLGEVTRACRSVCICSLVMHCGRSLRSEKVLKPVLRKGMSGEETDNIQSTVFYYPLAAFPPSCTSIWLKGEMVRHHPLCLHSQQRHPLPKFLLPLSHSSKPVCPQTGTWMSSGDSPNFKPIPILLQPWSWSEKKKNSKVKVKTKESGDVVVRGAAWAVAQEISLKEGRSQDI